jgi:hypothetical protein
MAAVTVSIFFLHYWRISRDRFFAFFSAAFAAMAINWIWLAISDDSREQHYASYLVRLLAFLIIIVGIIDKNRRSDPRRPIDEHR